jgi:hypothetical protein
MLLIFYTVFIWLVLKPVYWFGSMLFWLAWCNAVTTLPLRTQGPAHAKKIPLQPICSAKQWATHTTLPHVYIDKRLAVVFCYFLISLYIIFKNYLELVF